MPRRRAIPVIVLAALLLVRMCAAETDKKAAPAAAPVVPTPVVAIDELNRDGLSGKESLRMITLRGDDTVTVLSVRGGSALMPSNAHRPVPLRTEHAAELKRLLESKELARLGDLESLGAAAMGDVQRLTVRVTRPEGVQRFTVDGFTPPEALPRALRQLLCVTDKVKDDLQLAGDFLTIRYPNGREERRLRTWCDDAREQYGCEVRADGETLLEVHESEQTADDNVDRYLVVDANGHAEVTKRSNYSLRGLRQPVVRRCATLAPAQLAGLKKLLTSEEVRTLPAMPPFYVQRTVWRGYTMLVHHATGVQRVTMDATGAPAGAPAAEALACAVERVEHGLDAERPVASECRER